RRWPAGDAGRAHARQPAGPGCGRGPAGDPRAARHPRARPRNRGLRRGRPDPGGASVVRLGGARRAEWPRAAASPVIVYGRNPVHEALRGPRRVRRIWATKNALREPWLDRGQGSTTLDVVVASASAEE